MQPIRSIEDVRALEAGPYEQAIPARSPYGLIAAAARRFPERDAFIYLPTGELDAQPLHVPYAQLIAQVHQAANLFRSLGVGPGDAVALLVPNVPLAQAALWGAQVAGRACPINYMLQPEHVAALLRASGAKVIVAWGPDSSLAIWPAVQQVLQHAALPVLAIAGDLPLPDGVPDFGAAIASQAGTLQFEPVLHPDHIAACFHTGGTTGAPKLALHTQGNEAHTGWFAHAFYGFDQHTVEVNGFPLFHVAGAFVYGLALLAIGATQLLPTPTGMRNAAFVRNYWKFCERHRVTALAGVPTVLATLCGTPVDADISSVKLALTGGSPLPPALADQFEAATGIPVRNILGMTESAGLLAIEPAAAARVPGSVGLPLPFTQVRIVPWRDGAAALDEDCAAGETGVLVARGPHVGPGYSDPARNAGMFEAGWLVSGDLGHVDDRGYLHVTGRAKDVIIRGSHNLDPGLVEEAFVSHPAVALCAVVGEPDAYAGELPVAFVMLKPGASAHPSQLLAEVAPRVYERPAVPRRVTLLPSLPMTAIGKVYKPALRALAAEAKLREVLAALDVTVRAEERVGGVVGVIGLRAGDAALAAKVQALVAHIPMRCEVG